MTDVHKVTIQIRPPKGNFPGKIAEGYYCVVDGYVVLTDANGKPIGSEKRQIDGGDARLIACRMVRSNESRASVNGFNRPISYPPLKY